MILLTSATTDLPLSSSQPHLLTPQAKLQWTRCANLPVKTARPQSVMVGGRVYVGSGLTDSTDDDFLVCQYTPERNEWATLPPHTVRYFGLGQFQGDLITVGGLHKEDSLTGKVYRFNKQSHKWEESSKPMPTARAFLSLITTQSAIIACGGITGRTSDGKTTYCSTVEVYTTSTSQWSTTDPLPIACVFISSVTIGDTCYLLGGRDDQNIAVKTVLYAPISSLVQKARSQQAANSSHPDCVWKTLPDTPLLASAAASLGGCLLAVGGGDLQGGNMFVTVFKLLLRLASGISPAVHIFIPLTNCWVRVNSGDLPEPCLSSTAIQLPDNKLIVIGGSKDKKTVFMGSITR